MPPSNGAIKHPIRSKSSARMSLFTAIPWAIYNIASVRTMHPRNRQVTRRKKDTNLNAHEYYIRRRKCLQNISFNADISLGVETYQTARPKPKRGTSIGVGLRACLAWGIRHHGTMGQWKRSLNAPPSPKKGGPFCHYGLITCDGTVTRKVEYNV